MDKSKMMSIFSQVFDMLIGFLMVVTSWVAYISLSKIELTFWSNFLVGCVFIIGTLCQIFMKKKFPEYLYLCSAVVLLIVFLICMAFISIMNFKGAFLFLHIINPLLVLLRYLFFTNITEIKNKFLLTTLGFPFCYMIFALCYGLQTQNWIYPFLDPNSNGFWYVAIFLLVTGLFVIMLTFALYYLNIIVNTFILLRK